MSQKIDLYATVSHFIHIDLETPIHFKRYKKQYRDVQDYFTAIFLYYKLKLRRQKKARCARASMEPRESTTQSRSPASETVDRDGASESTHTCIPLNSSDSPDEWKFNTVGDLLENKHMYKSVKSILKSIIKKFFYKLIQTKYLILYLTMRF